MNLPAAIDALEREVREQLRRGAPGIDPMASVNRRHLDERFAAVRDVALTRDPADGTRTERLAVVAAARRLLEAHDRIIASRLVTRDDTFAMKNAADILRDVLRELDAAPRLVACPACPHWMHLHEADGSCAGGCHGPLASRPVEQDRGR